MTLNVRGEGGLDSARVEDMVKDYFRQVDKVSHCFGTLLVEPKHKICVLFQACSALCPVQCPSESTLVFLVTEPTADSVDRAGYRRGCQGVCRQGREGCHPTACQISTGKNTGWCRIVSGRENRHVLLLGCPQSH